MRYRNLILPLMLSLFVLPLTARGQTASGAVQPDAANFRIVLLDGSAVKGALSFVMNLDTQYGKIAISSSTMVSAKLDITSQWADIHMKDIEMRVKYKPATSDFKVTSSVGPLSIDITQVALIVPANQQAAIPTVAAANQNAAVDQTNVPPPSVAYVPQSPPYTVSQPTVVYQYPYQYQYAPPASYYDYAPYYSSGPYVGWPYFGIGIGVGRGFGGFRGGFRGGFSGGFRGGFGGGGFGHGGHR
jgi:hypothetical protein